MTTTNKKEKVILDSDMVESFDDGVAMLMLAHDPSIELLGVTIISGNTWIEQGLAYAIRQLELDKLDHIPVYAGFDLPLRPNRRDNFEKELALYGEGYDLWYGSFRLDRPKSWQEVYKNTYHEEPRLAPKTEHAVNFIIDTVRKNPGEVTIAMIGPCTNLAIAVRMAPDIVPLIKRVIYMGGSFFKPGNGTATAEFNFLYDPEAAKIAFRTAFKEQILVGLDVCEDVPFVKENYDKILAAVGNSKQKEILLHSLVGRNFTSNPNFKHYIWDVIVSAIIIDPSLVTEERNYYIDINDQFGPSYGQSIAYPHHGPEFTQKARIITKIDKQRFWNMVYDKKYWPEN